MEKKALQKEISKIYGKCGVITVCKHSRKLRETDQDIHKLIARVLLMKEKRLKAREKK